MLRMTGRRLGGGRMADAGECEGDAADPAISAAGAVWSTPTGIRPTASQTEE